MTKELKIVGGVSLLVMIALIGVCFAAATTPSEEQSVYLLPVENNSTEAAMKIGAIPSDDCRYVVRVGENGLVVSAPGSDQPVMTFDIPTEKLRTSDRQSLSDGIEVDSEEALWQLIEDFSS